MRIRTTHQSFTSALTNRTSLLVYVVVLTVAQPALPLANFNNAGVLQPANLTNNSGATAQDDESAGPCIPPPLGMVSWWSMDFSLTDSVDGNNPADAGGVGFAPGKVGSGVTFTTGGFIEIPDSTNLRLQQFTLDAWVRPDGPGPTKDEYGSVIIVKNVVPANQSAGLLWSALDNRFRFLFGHIATERIVSKGVFPAKQFYHVAATYDGASFKLWVNGQLQGEFNTPKTVTYSKIPWAIGGSASFARKGYPRTWNGVIDEVEIFDRALDASEILLIFKAGNGGKCKKSCLGQATTLRPDGERAK